MSDTLDSEAARRAEIIARQMLQDVVDGADPSWAREDILMGLGWALLLTARAAREVQPDDVDLVDDAVMTVMGLLLDDCRDRVEAA